MKTKTPVSREDNKVLDADGKIIFGCHPDADPGPLKDVVLMLNHQHLLVEACILWHALFEEKEAKDKLAEIVGQEEANAALAKTMIAVHPRMWDMASERRAEEKLAFHVAESAQKAFPALIALLNPDAYPAVLSFIGQEGVDLLERLIGAAARASVLEQVQAGGER